MCHVDHTVALYISPLTLTGGCVWLQSAVIGGYITSIMAPISRSKSSYSCVVRGFRRTCKTISLMLHEFSYALAVLL